MMKKLSLISRLVWTFSALVLTAATMCQESSNALETTRKIADKIIDETRFEYRLVPLSYNGGITRFTIEDPSSESESQVYYAYGTMNSELDTSGILGLSFSGRIRLFLNNEEVFTGSSSRVELKEYTYNRYRFRHRIPVKWVKGENRLLVKCDPGKEPVTVLVLPVDELDAKVAYVKALPVSTGSPDTHWLTSGPWNTPAGDGMDHAFPPENGFQSFYRDGDQIMGWQQEEVPLLRELVIPETNSYQRDAYADWHYANGGTMLGILSLYETSRDERYLEFVKQFARNIWENDAYFRWQYFTLHAMRGSYHRINRMTMLDDSGGPAIPFAQLMLTDPSTPYCMPILDRILEYVYNDQERLQDRTFSRPDPEPATVWADDLFMSVPFLLRMAKVMDFEQLYDEVAQQVIHFNKYLADPGSGLYFHGWYHNRQQNTPVLWGRANGWIIWATSEALAHMPPDHREYRTILKIFKNHMEALARHQDPSGMWHQVLDHPETFEETSCTAMFTLGMARGVRMGWLPESYRDQALKGWQALQQKIMEDGTIVDICRGTGIGDDVEFYEARQRFDHDPRGLGAMITAGCEITLLEDQ